MTGKSHITISGLTGAFLSAMMYPHNLPVIGLGFVLGAYSGISPDLDVTFGGTTYNGKHVPMGRKYATSLLLYPLGGLGIVLLNKIFTKNATSYDAHRKFTHSIAGLLTFVFANSLVYMFQPQVSQIIKSMNITGWDIKNAIGFYIFIGMWGYLMHLIADMITVSGIPLFYPFSKKNFHIVPRFLRVKTKSTGEFMYTSTYALITVYLIANLLR